MRQAGGGCHGRRGRLGCRGRGLRRGRGGRCGWTALFAASPYVTIGRAPQCDITLSHPTVSAYHALIERVPDGLRLTDLSSQAGVTVAGRRTREPVLVREHEPFGVGPFLFKWSGGVLHCADGSRSLRLEAHGIEKSIPLGRGKRRKLLDDINLVVEPGEFVSLLGPSGSGKSTLMDCLNGRRRATGGRVLANGEDFYRHFDSFRQSLGYVPQKDIVHTQLTRLPRPLLHRPAAPADRTPTRPNWKPASRRCCKQMELGPHRDTLVGEPQRRADQARQPRGGTDRPDRACSTSTRRPAASTPAPRPA